MRARVEKWTSWDRTSLYTNHAGMETNIYRYWYGVKNTIPVWWFLYVYGCIFHMGNNICICISFIHLSKDMNLIALPCQNIYSKGKNSSVFLWYWLVIPVKNISLKYLYMLHYIIYTTTNSLYINSKGCRVWIK